MINVCVSKVTLQEYLAQKKIDELEAEHKPSMKAKYEEYIASNEIVPE